MIELASMLAGERFSDRPPSVCPMIAAILRAYNDLTDDRRRADLYRYAAEVVGTRADPRLERRRAQMALAWARSMREQRARSRWRLRRAPVEPGPDDGPDLIAFYVVCSIGRRHSDESHAGWLALVDRLIAMRAEEQADDSGPPALVLGPIFGDVVEQLADAIEDPRRDQQLLLAELG